MMETASTTTWSRQSFTPPAAYENLEYRQWLYIRWMQEAMAAHEALADINNSPYYGSSYCGGGWRVD